MTAAEFLRELAVPLRSPAVAVPLLVFFLLLQLVYRAGLLGIWLAVLVLPALLRFLMTLLEARARGRDPETPGIEEFNPVNGAWNLFPIVPIVAAGYLAAWLGTHVAAEAATVAGVAFVAVLPAILAVLVISRSPLESINPLAIGRLIRHAGPGYWYAPLLLVAATVLLTLLSGLPSLLRDALELYLLFAAFCVTGATLRAAQLIDSVDVPEVDLPASSVPPQARLLAGQRRAVLNHAYGLASRGNVDGGLAHLRESLRDDPDPAAARAEYFDAMLHWEDNFAALRFAQEYLGHLLGKGDHRAANKLLLRCHAIEPAFRPLPADREAAIAALRRCGNDELADRLSPDS